MSAANPSGHRLPFPQRAAILLLLVAFAFAFQGSRGLFEPDEGRYTNIACQMLRSGDYLVPAFNSEHPHFAKPPLTYWAIAAGIRLAGWNEWGVRLFHGLAFIGTVLLVADLGRTVTPRRPWLPALIYATFPMAYFSANIATTDVLLAFWETLAVAAFVRWWSAGRSRSDLLLVWSAFGFAFLTKGPPGLLPLLAILSFAFLAGGRSTALALFRPLPLLAFALIGLSWYVAIAATHPGVLSYFIHDEVVERIASTQHHRHGEWYGAAQVYIPMLLGGTIPWWIPLARMLRRVATKPFTPDWWTRSRTQDDPWGRFLALWFLLPMAVFCISKSRLALYILPLFVPLALMAARQLGAWTPSRRQQVGLGLWIIVLLIAKGAAAFVPNHRESRSLANEIKSRVHPAPSEIVFAGARPVWGLGFYLQCEVERIITGDDTREKPGGNEEISEELGEREAGFLILAANRRLELVQEQLREVGYHAEPMTQIGEWSLISPFDDLTLGPAR